MLWVAKFRLKDDRDIYTPFCKKLKVEFFAFPYTSYLKSKTINLLVGGILSGSEKHKKEFVEHLSNDKRVQSIQQHHDFILVHAQHPTSREAQSAIRIFYNPLFIKTKPVHLAADGWEYWEVASLDRSALNRLIQTATRYYQGKLLSLKREKIHSIASLEFAPRFTEKQLGALRTAYKEGYYNYPRKRTIPQLASLTKKSYSTFQENLRKAENKLIAYFLKYR